MRQKRQLEVASVINSHSLIEASLQSTIALPETICQQAYCSSYLADVMLIGRGRNLKFLIAFMRGTLLSIGITPPAPQNERKTVIVLLLLLLGCVAATWLVFKYLA